MSAALLRRGLELLEPPGRAKAPPGVQRGRAGPRAAGAARRKRRAAELGRNKATVKGRVVKSAIVPLLVSCLDEQLMLFVPFCFAPEEYHKKKPVNHLRENLKYMLKGRLVADKAVAEQILAQNRGRKSKDQPPEKREKKKPEGTVFTEEDFRKFEREYFGVP